VPKLGITPPLVAEGRPDRIQATRGAALTMPGFDLSVVSQLSCISILLAMGSFLGHDPQAGQMPLGTGGLAPFRFHPNAVRRKSGTARAVRFMEHGPFWDLSTVEDLCSIDEAVVARTARFAASHDRLPTVSWRR